MSSKWRFVLWAALALGALAAFDAWQQHLVAKGDKQGAARVYAEWNGMELKRLAAEKTRKEQADAERLAAEKAERHKEQAKQLKAERVANDQAVREEKSRRALVVAEQRNRGLLDTIAQLNARAAERADVPSTCTAASIAACTGEAATARELLGRCSTRYSELAGSADELRDQVVGLQDFLGALSK